MTTMTNREFAAKDDTFRSCCSEAGVEPSVRQASKYRRGRGKAVSKRTAIIARRA